MKKQTLEQRIAELEARVKKLEEIIKPVSPPWGYVPYTPVYSTPHWHGTGQPCFVNPCVSS